MVRTADTAFKVGGKAFRKGGSMKSANATSRSKSPTGSGEKGFSSYNSVCPRETPSWQKPITSFFNSADTATSDQHKQSASKYPQEDVNMEESASKDPQEDINMSEHGNQNEEIVKVKSESSNNHDDINNGNKENYSPSNIVAIASNENAQNVNGMDMKELTESTKKKVNMRDDYDEIVPKKKIKLDQYRYQNFEMLEQTDSVTS